MQQYRFLLPISALFTATLLLANTMNTKIFDLFGLSLPAGIIVFPLAFLVGDLLTEVYGYATTRKVVWSGFAALVLMVVSYQIAVAVPPAGFWPHQEAFADLFANVPRVALASLVAYFCGEFVNSFVVAKMKVWTKGRYMAGRFVASTMAGQLVDTVVFVVIAFAGTMSLSVATGIVLSAWAVKVAWEVIALPISLPLVQWVKKAEQQDHYDTKTNFNPFKV